MQPYLKLVMNLVTSRILVAYVPINKASGRHFHDSTFNSCKSRVHPHAWEIKDEIPCSWTFCKLKLRHGADAFRWLISTLPMTRSRHDDFICFFTELHKGYNWLLLFLRYPAFSSFKQPMVFL
nr:hypothetical protein CFP56_03158 [Quercus suber]